MNVAAVDVRQLQQRSFKQKKLVGQACGNKHTLKISQFSNSCILVFLMSKGAATVEPAADGRVTVKKTVDHQ